MEQWQHLLNTKDYKLKGMHYYYVMLHLSTCTVLLIVHEEIEIPSPDNHILDNCLSTESAVTIL